MRGIIFIDIMKISKIKKTYENHEKTWSSSKIMKILKGHEIYEKSWKVRFSKID